MIGAMNGRTFSPAFQILIASLLVAGSFFMLSGCGEQLGQRFPPYRYKLEAQVETPQGVRKGHSVIEVQWNQGSKALWRSLASAGYEVKGEAVAVDLPDGETLFVLLRSKESVDWAARGAADILENVTTAVGADRDPHPLPRTRNSPFGRKEPVNNYPYFVRFTEIKDPKTVEEVDPHDLVKTFGTGYKLKGLTVQITDESVTWSIERRLRWVDSMEHHDFDKEGSFKDKYPEILLGLRKK